MNECQVGTLGYRELPANWRWTRLGEVCQQDRRIVESTSSHASMLPYLGLEDIESQTGKVSQRKFEGIGNGGISTTFAFDTRHVLYGKLRPYLNKVALPNFEGRCTTELIPLLPQEELDRHYLAWLLRRNETVDAAMREKTGSRMPRANMDIILSLVVPIPPLPEQKRIAAILNDQIAAVDRAHAAAEAQLEAAQNLFTAYLRQVIPDHGQSLPPGWRWARLGEVCNVVTGGTPARSESRYFGGDIPWIKPEDLDISVYVYSSAEFLSKDGVNVARLLPKDSVLVSCIGNIGKIAIAGVPLTTNQQINSLIPKEGVEPLYLYYCCKYFQPIFKKESSTALLSILNKSSFSNISIPLPPLSEQKRIATILNKQMIAAKQVSNSVERQISKINHLPSALLRRAFNGDI